MSASLPELIDLAARHKFEGISVRPTAFFDAEKNGLTAKALRKRISDAGLSTSIIDGLTSALPGVPSVETLDPAIRAQMPHDALYPPKEDVVFRCAEEMGIPDVNVVHYRGTEIPLEQMAEAVGALCRRAQQRGLRIVLEFVPTTGLRSLKFAQGVIAAAGEKNCAVLLDFFHHDRTGGTTEDIKNLPPNTIANIQISDRDRATGPIYPPMTGRKLMGEGNMPLKEWMKAALANSPKATVDLEVLNAELRAMPNDEAASKLYTTTKAWMATLA
jgi:sugar phosphate isomerase/epimerase